LIFCEMVEGSDFVLLEAVVLLVHMNRHKGVLVVVNVMICSHRQAEVIGSVDMIDRGYCRSDLLKEQAA